MKSKRYKIRLCDHDWYWDVNAGNSDALCNEDSRDPHCSICDKNMSCKFANFPYFDEKRYVYNAEEDVYYYNFDYKFKTKKHRKSLRNTEICKKCAYNDHYDWVDLNKKEQRKYKLIELERNQNEKK